MKIGEIFLSVQGEGRYIGRPQVFIRLAGCNLRCGWCDTKRSWKGGKEMTIKEVMAKAAKFNLKSVCITGGEPMLQKEELRALIALLKRRGYEIVLETNGTLYDKRIFDMVDCVSCDMKPPSSGERSDERLLPKLKRKDQVKIIIKDGKDFEYAMKIVKKARIEVILQPAGGRRLKPLIGKVLRKRADCRVLPQLHRIGGIR